MNLPFRSHHLLTLLDEWEKTFFPLDGFLARYFKNHKQIGSKDRKWITETVYQLVRFKEKLDYLVKKPTWLTRFERLSRLLDKELFKKAPLHIQSSFPKWYFTKLFETYGEKTVELCEILNQKAPTTIRVNTLLAKRDELFERFSKDHSLIKTKISPLGITWKERIHFFVMEEFQKGFFEIQDEGSQIIALFIDAKPGEKILDYCSGSGGKTLAFAPFMEKTGQVFLHDIRTSALKQAKKRLKRAHIQNAQIVLPVKKAKNRLMGKMDKVLVDAPCSGSGTLRRNPEMKEKLDINRLNELIFTQRAIFEEALEFLKKDGTIFYATCSIFPEENEKQVAYFVKHLGLTCLEQKTLLPKKGAHDGFFMAALKKIC